MPPTAVVCLAPGFEEIEAVTAIDVLRRAGVEVRVLGVGGAEIEGSRGVRVRADAELTAAEPVPGAVVLPGGMPGAENLGRSPLVAELVRGTLDAGGLVGAICAAPACALAPFGVLDGRRATCYPGFEDRFPPTATHVEERVVVDGPVVTSRGPGTALDFALRLVTLLVDAEKASALRAGMLVS